VFLRGGMWRLLPVGGGGLSANRCMLLPSVGDVCVVEGVDRLYIYKGKSGLFVVAYGAEWFKCVSFLTILGYILLIYSSVGYYYYFCASL
jgi:hypothetical protein